MQGFKKLISSSLLFLVLITISSCSFLDILKKKEPVQVCSLVIDSTNLLNSSRILGDNVLQLEVFFIRKRHFFKPRKTPLNLSLDLLNLKEIRKCEVLSHYSCDHIGKNMFKDLIELEKNTTKVLVVIKEMDKILAYELTSLDPGDLKILRIELIGKSIKISKNQ